MNIDYNIESIRGVHSRWVKAHLLLAPHLILKSLNLVLMDYLELAYFLTTPLVTISIISIDVFYKGRHRPQFVGGDGGGGGGIVGEGGGGGPTGKSN